MNVTKSLPPRLTRASIGKWGWDVVAVAFVGCLLCLPLWLVHRPPLQDLPQHVAAVQVLSRYWDSSWHFSEYFELHLLRTQYLTVYFAAVPLSWLFGSLFAVKAVLSIALVATPLSLLATLRALGKDGWLSLLILPLAYNAHVMTGFVNFVTAIPMMFFGIAVAIRHYQAPSNRSGWWLAGLAFATFYTHIVPFGLLTLAVLGLAFHKRATDFVWRLWPLGPSLLAVLLWALTSPAGAKLLQMGKAGAGTLPPRYVPIPEALRGIGDWLTPGLPGEADATRLVLWFLLVSVLFTLSAAATPARKAAASHEAGRKSLQRLAFLLPVCLAGYFWLPVSYDFMWPISLRFPLLAAYLLPLWLSRAPSVAQRLAAVLATALTASALMDTSVTFSQFERTDMQGFDEVVARIPHGSRVAGLIFNARSEATRQPSLLQSVAWVQAEKGGAVMFTFADFPQSPFAFREENRPPRVAPRWEWEPNRVVPARDLTWYNYVLVHGGPGVIATAGTFHKVIQSGRWSLWTADGH